MNEEFTKIICDNMRNNFCIICLNYCEYRKNTADPRMTHLICKNCNFQIYIDDCGDYLKFHVNNWFYAVYKDNYHYNDMFFHTSSELIEWTNIKLMSTSFKRMIKVVQELKIFS